MARSEQAIEAMRRMAHAFTCTQELHRASQRTSTEPSSDGFSTVIVGVVN